MRDPYPGDTPPRRWLYMYTFVNLPSKEKQQIRRVIHRSIIKSTGARSWWGSPVRINPFSSGSSRMGHVWEVRADGEKMTRAPNMFSFFLVTWNSGAFFFLNGKIHLNQSSKHQFSGDIRIRSFGKGYNVFFEKLEVVAQFWCLNRETNSKIRPNDLGCSILYTHLYAIYNYTSNICTTMMVEGFFPQWLLERCWLSMVFLAFGLAKCHFSNETTWFFTIYIYIGDCTAQL